MKSATAVIFPLRACLKIPERGCVVFDQPQPTSNFLRFTEVAACCGWSATQPRSVFRQALRNSARMDSGCPTGGLTLGA